MYDLLPVQLRNQGDTKPSQLRRQGVIPGILFAKGMDSIPVKFSQSDFNKILSHGVKVFELEVTGEEKVLVSLENLQRDPVNYSILHVSLHRLEKNKDTHVLVPIKLAGTAAGLKEGGVIRQLLDEVIVLGLPRQIPEVLTVDVELLKVGDHISVSDIKLDSKLSFDESDLEKAVVNCAIPKFVEEPVPEEIIGQPEPGEEKDAPTPGDDPEGEAA